MNHTNLRRYNLKGELVSWRQKKCKCGRFLGMKQKEYCSKCKNGAYNSYYKLKGRVRHNSSLKVGDYV
jgi:hypothetical protein